MAPPLHLHLHLHLHSLLFLSLLLMLLLLPSQTRSHLCSSPHDPTRPSCPPFPTSSLPYPFASFPGCGHPSFHLRCATPYSIISINGLSFSLLRYDPNSSLLTLSPLPKMTTSSSSLSNSSDECSQIGVSRSIPDKPVTFSGSPFRISDAICSRLSMLRPCTPPSLPNCSRCPWECRLVKNPGRILRDCASSNGHRFASQQGCQADVLGYLDSVLKWGIDVQWDTDRDSYFASCKACRADHGVCGFNASDSNKSFICFHSQSRVSPTWFRQGEPYRIAVMGTIFAFMCLLIIFSGIVAILRSRRAASSEEEDPTSVFLRRHRSVSLLPPVFTYEELESSTNRFDPDRKIGDGGFGSVYLGQLRDGRIVAVKYLHKHHNAANTAAAAKAFSTKSFCNEILILSSIHHPNLVKLHGYCSDPRGLLLVYDYVPNGTLADHLHGGPKRGSLTWQVRLDIALQIALAIDYLHFSVNPPIVHRDITSSNIFVERDMTIKVGDFGLSRLLVFDRTASSTESEYIWTGPQGTPGYLDPDYHRSFRLTEKSDVYSFGVVLLELITGQKAVDQRRAKVEVALADLVVSRIQTGALHQVVDPAMAAVDTDGVNSVAELAFRCVAADKDDRPDAREVAAELKRIRGRARAVGGGGAPEGAGVLADVAIE